MKTHIFSTILLLLTLGLTSCRASMTPNIGAGSSDDTGKATEEDEASDCTEGYTENEGSCVAAVITAPPAPRTASCTGLIADAEWVEGEFQQTNVAGVWTPETIAATFTNNDSKECTFKCKSGFFRKSTSCLAKEWQYSLADDLGTPHASNHLAENGINRAHGLVFDQAFVKIDANTSINLVSGATQNGVLRFSNSNRQLNSYYHFKSTGTFEIKSLDTDSEGNFILVAEASGTTFSLAKGGTADVAVHTISGNEDLFLFYFDSNGDFKWSRQFGSSTDDNISAGSKVHVFTDRTNIILGVIFSANLSLIDHKSTLIRTITNRGSKDYAVMSLSKLGALRWARNFGSTGDEYDMGIHFNEDLGRIAVKLTTKNINNLEIYNEVNADMGKLSGATESQATVISSLEVDDGAVEWLRYNHLTGSPAKLYNSSWRSPFMSNGSILSTMFFWRDGSGLIEIKDQTAVVKHSLNLQYQSWGTMLVSFLPSGEVEWARRIGCAVQYCETWWNSFHISKDSEVYSMDALSQSGGGGKDFRLWNALDDAILASHTEQYESIYLLKNTTAGALAWHIRFKGSLASGNAWAIGDDDVFVGVKAKSSATIEARVSDSTILSIATTAETDNIALFFIKDADGTVRWNRVLSGPGTESITKLSIAEDGNPVAQISTDGIMIEVRKEDNSVIGTIKTPGTEAQTVIKFDAANGNILWARSFTGDTVKVASRIETTKLKADVEFTGSILEIYDLNSNDALAAIGNGGGTDYLHFLDIGAAKIDIGLRAQGSGDQKMCLYQISTGFADQWVISSTESISPIDSPAFVKGTTVLHQYLNAN
jgi:hypothetical protein